MTAAGVLFGAGNGHAQAPVAAGGTLFNVPVKSLVEMRFENVVQQKHDLSCGAAAMATLLKYYYHEEIDEQAIIEGIFEFGDRENISRDGFSVKELKRYANERGFSVQSFRMRDVDVLRDIRLPFLSLISVGSYLHFVVVRGIEGDTVYVADPAFGNLRMDIEKFERIWTKRSAYFVVDYALNDEIARTKAIPERFAAQTLAFLDAGRVLTARSQEVQTLIDHGFRPMQPAFGTFR